MSISQEGLFKIALGLEKPWYIKAIDFNVEEKQLDLHIDFETGSKFPCPLCGKSGCHIHDTIERKWRRLPAPLIVPEEMLARALNGNPHLRQFRILFITGIRSGVLSRLDRSSMELIVRRAFTSV